jgi:hypothetical protein
MKLVMLGHEHWFTGAISFGHNTLFFGENDNDGMFYLMSGEAWSQLTPDDPAYAKGSYETISLKQAKKWIKDQIAYVSVYEPRLSDRRYEVSELGALLFKVQAATHIDGKRQNPIIRMQDAVEPEEQEAA